MFTSHFLFHAYAARWFMNYLIISSLGSVIPQPLMFVCNCSTLTSTLIHFSLTWLLLYEHMHVLLHYLFSYVVPLVTKFLQFGLVYIISESSIRSIRENADKIESSVNQSCSLSAKITSVYLRSPILHST